ncbi:MAG: molybdopterin molybdotransferase MoeA [Syntrophomonas sp.]|nr:molybdopterin molybdotransferase MoeA [Syntrophomonas sp.]
MLVDASLEEVQIELLKHSQRLEDEYVSILEAVGRVSAEDLNADSDLPDSHQSAVDGYAVADENPMEAGKYYITGYLCLGDIPSVSLEPGQAMGVLTGGDLPSGSRAVIPHEKVEIQDNYLRSMEVIKPGNNIKQAGEDYVKGNQLLGRGSVLTPGDISLLAAYGKTSIVVYRKPRVAVLCLSRHVVAWQLNPEPGQIKDSNGPLLSALVMQDGGVPVSIKMARKDETSVKTLALDLLEQADILIITGGTYAQGGNEARLLMEDLGAELLYWDVPIQPGSHTGASIWNSHLLFALSGNPAACAVGYQLFVAPAVRAMQGLIPHFKHLKARCINGFPKKSGSRRFIRGYASWDEDGWKVAVLPGQKPSMIRSLVNCNALIDMPAESPPVEEGQDVSILLLNSVY